MSDREFVAWPKIARLNRDITITEKLDGTNACIIITEDDIYAQSRTRVITPASDNYGFAKWVEDNAGTLISDLGDGRHFGEWWGQGIQRKYGQSEKRFSLFDTHKWNAPGSNQFFQTPGLGVVPVLYDGPFNQQVIDDCVGALAAFGSIAAPGFKPAEGIVVFHSAAHVAFKVTIDGDEAPKNQPRDKDGNAL